MAFPINEIFSKKLPGKAGHTDLVDVEDDEQQGNDRAAAKGDDPDNPDIRMSVRMAQVHAPKGGVSIGGKKFKGGEFIPGEDLAKATPEEKAKIEGEVEEKPSSIADAIDAEVAKGTIRAFAFEKVAKELDMSEDDVKLQYANELGTEAAKILLTPGGWNDPRIDEISDLTTDVLAGSFNNAIVRHVADNLPDDLSKVDEEALASIQETIGTNPSSSDVVSPSITSAFISITSEIDRRAREKETQRVKATKAQRVEVQADTDVVRKMKDTFDEKNFAAGDNLKLQAAYFEGATEAGANITVNAAGTVQADRNDRAKVKVHLSRQLGEALSKKVPRKQLTAANFAIREWHKASGVGEPTFEGLPDAVGPRGDQRDAVKLVQSIVNAWAASSTNGNAVSIAMQRAISERFGLGRDVAAASDEGSTAGNGLYNAHFEAFDAAVETIYNRTQERLKAAGVREVVLWRGSAFKEDPESLKWMGQGDTVTANPVLKMNPVSSFAMSFDVARWFSASEESRINMMTATAVPAEQIFSLASDGPGCLTESEALVIGKNLKKRISIATRGGNLGHTSKEFWKRAEENAGEPK